MSATTRGPQCPNANWILSEIEQIRIAQKSMQDHGKDGAPELSSVRRSPSLARFEMLARAMKALPVDARHDEIVLKWKAVLQPAGLSNHADLNADVVKALEDQKAAAAKRRSGAPEGVEKVHDV